MDLSKLQAQVYSQELEQNKNYIKAVKEHIDGYKKVEKGLEELVKNLSVNCMIPIGKRAMMEGKLVHTNEILVCIGDGYFVKYSAQQAMSLCNRRTKNYEETLEKLERERDLLETRQMLPMNFDAFETDDCKELIELWDEEQLENWKIEHRKRVKEYRQKLKDEENKIKEDSCDDDLFKTHDRLEIKEKSPNKHDILENEDDVNKNEDNDEDDEEDDYDDEEEDEDEDDDYEDDDDDEEDYNESETSYEKEELESVKNNFIDSEILDEKKIDLLNTHHAVDVVSTESTKETKNIDNNSTIIIPSKINKINGKFEVSIIKEDYVKSESQSDEFKNKLNFKDNEINLGNQCSNVSFKNLKKKVSFGDPHFFENEIKENEDEACNSNDTIEIKFKHTEIESLNTENVDNNEINNPRDIYEIFTKPKSILKNPHVTNYVYQENKPIIEDIFAEEHEETNESRVKKFTLNPVMNVVQERKIDSFSTKPLEMKNNNNQRPVSRFKLERAQKKKL